MKETEGDIDAGCWVKQLLAAGWTRAGESDRVWQSPEGHLFRGPYLAWTEMRRRERSR